MLCALSGVGAEAVRVALGGLAGPPTRCLTFAT